jgi:CBS domain-containing protein
MSTTLLVRDYMAHQVVTVDVSDSVFDATEKLVKNNVGCIVATENGEVSGIVTKGDILKNSLLKLRDPVRTNVGSVMTRPFITIEADASLEDAANLMSEKQVSKLPVLEDGLLVGIITATDIMRVEPDYVKYLKDLIDSKKPAFSKVK